MTTARSTFDVTRALVIAGALGLVAFGASVSFAPEADAARPRLVRDWCTQTSGGGEGLECNSADDLLVRTQNPDGSCGAWICCPPNGDGTYNCNAGSSPSGQRWGVNLGNIAAPRATTASPGAAVDPGVAPQVPRATRRTRRGN